MGFDAPYVPGWDCHGLPIEQQVDKKLGLEEEGHERRRDPQGLPRVRRAVHRDPARGIPAPRRGRQLGAPLHDDELRLRGRDRPGLRRLLRQGPALPGPEVGALVLHRPHRAGRGGARIRGARGSRRSPSPFRPTSAIGAERFPNAGLLVWTTTPWTLPPTSRSPSTPTRPTPSSRRAARAYVVAEKLVAAVAKDAGWADWKTLATLPGAKLAGLRLPSSPATGVPRRADGRGGGDVVSRRARRPRHHGRRHRPRPHGDRPRRGRLPDGPARGPSDPLPGGRRGPLHDRREVPRQEGARRERRDRRGPQGLRRPGRARSEVPARVPALLAL